MLNYPSPSMGGGKYKKVIIANFENILNYGTLP
ncbi:MAG: hypothetical protein ACI8PD_000112 [Nitrospinales bacterium]|jgi:hypothetical protein